MGLGQKEFFLLVVGPPGERDFCSCGVGLGGQGLVRELGGIKMRWIKEYEYERPPTQKTGQITCGPLEQRQKSSEEAKQVIFFCFCQNFGSNRTSTLYLAQR